MKYIHWASLALYRTNGTHFLDFGDTTKSNVRMTFVLNFTVEEYLFEFNGAIQKEHKCQFGHTDATQSNI
jgi:hypothetical protein